MSINDLSSHETRILALLRRQIIPVARQNGDKQIICARRKQADLKLPHGVVASSAQKLGKKQSPRGNKAYDRYITIALWPDEGQESLRIPMLWYVTAGNLRLRLGEYYLHLPAGYAVLIPPGIPAPWGLDYDGPNKFCDVFIITPRGRQMQCRVRQHRDGDVQQIESISILNTVLADDLDRIVEELRDGGLNSREIASQSLLILWLTLERELAQRRFVNLLPASVIVSHSASYNHISIAKQHMQAHLHQRLTLNNVAQAVRLSRTQFSLLFRQETGQGFVEYLTQLRIEWACQLLRETGWSVRYISTFVGFKAPAYFHRLFRRKMGMTPQEYRQLNGEKLHKRKNECE